MKLTTRRAIAGLTVVVFVLFAVSVVIWWHCNFGGSEEDYCDRPTMPSTDLAADLKLMWQTTDTRSTAEAIYAAERVFATVELIGLTREQVIARLGDPETSNDSRYNFSFYPVGCRVMVYRFDTGFGGCQYNVRFGWDGRVRRVLYMGIE